MRLIKNVQSSNKDFKEVEFNVDTVYKRSNPRKWEEEIDGKLEWLGWIYDEEQYSYNEYMEQLDGTNSEAHVEIVASQAISTGELLGTVSTMQIENSTNQAVLIGELMGTIATLQAEIEQLKLKEND